MGLFSYLLLSLVGFIIAAQTGYLPERFLSLYALVLHAIKKKARFAPKKSRKFNFSKVYNGIIVGSQPRNESEFRMLKADYGITAIVSLNEERELYVPSKASCFNNLNEEDIDIDSVVPIGKISEPKILRLHLPVPDYQGPSEELLKTAVRFIDAQVRSGGTVFVHCNGGKGRSVAVVIAYMVANSEKQYLGLNEAWKICKGRRKQTSKSLLRYPITSQSRNLTSFVNSNKKTSIMDTFKRVEMSNLAVQLPTEYNTPINLEI